MAERGTIYLGVLIVDVETPWAQSLKQKRAVLTPIVERMRRRFALSVARLDGLDSHSWERIGVSAIGNDRIVVERLLGRALGLVATSDVRVGDHTLDVEVWDGPEWVHPGR